jgi:hypothetical protein
MTVIAVASLTTFTSQTSCISEPLGATIVPLFGSSVQTQLTNYSGDKKEWPVNWSLGNIDSTIRSKPSNRARILVALLPIPPKCHFKGHAKNNCREGTTNAQSKGFKGGLRAYF